MSGIRLHHPVFRAAEGSTLTYVVELPQPYPVPYDCPECQTPHAHKAIHLRLDGNGDVIVSQQVYLALQAVPLMAGLEVMNEVENPPPLFIGAVQKDAARIVSLPLGQVVTENGIRPEVSKYEGRDKLWKPYQPLIDEAQDKAEREAHRKKRNTSRTFT